MASLIRLSLRNKDNNNANSKKEKEKSAKELRNIQRSIAKYNIQLADPTPFAGNPSNIRAKAAEGINMSGWEKLFKCFNKLFVLI